MPTVNITAPTDDKLSHTYAGQSGRGRDVDVADARASGMVAAAAAAAAGSAASERFTAAVK